jgi:hypothetical protein
MSQRTYDILTMGRSSIDLYANEEKDNPKLLREEAR